MSLVRSPALFRNLFADTLERLAQAREPVDFPAGEVLVRQGDEGTCYYAIVSGEVEISRSGRRVATLGRGEGLGEIALLREGRRTATAVASTAVAAYSLDRESFLTAVNTHDPTRQWADRVVREVEGRDARRDGAPERPSA